MIVRDARGQASHPGWRNPRPHDRLPVPVYRAASDNRMQTACGGPPEAVVSHFRLIAEGGKLTGKGSPDSEVRRYSRSVIDLPCMNSSR